MINIKELTGARLKKALGLKRVTKGWHNKNRTGGNFGFNMVTHDQRFYELTGHHDTQGVVRDLRLSENMRPITAIFHNDDYLDATYDGVISITERMIE